MAKRAEPEEIIAKLREVEVRLSQGESVGMAAKSIGVTEQTYYRWRKEYGGLQVNQAKRLKDMEKENQASGDEDDGYAYVVATSKRGSRSILHRRGGCWRAKRLAFNNYELVKSDGKPLASFYDGYCRDCWKGDGGPWNDVKDQIDDEVVSGEAGSSTSSSS